MNKENIDTRRGLRISTIEGCFAGIHGAFSIGNIYPLGFVMLLGATPLHYGFLAAIPPFVNVIPIFTAILLNRVGQRKYLTALTGFTGRILWMFVPLIPCLFADSIALTVFFLIYGMSFAALSISGNVWTSWMSDLVPEKLRASYFGRRNMYITAITLLTVIAVGKFISFFQMDKNNPLHTVDPHGGIARFFNDLFPFFDRIKEFMGGDIYKATEMVGLSFLFIASSVAALLSLYFLLRQPEPPRASFAGGASFDWREYRKDKKFTGLLLFIIMWSFLNGFAGPFWGPFLLKDLAVRYDYFAGLAVAGSLARIIGLRFWGRLIDKYGNRPVMLFAVYIGAFHPLLYLFATPTFLFPIWIDYISSGLIWSGMELALFNMLLGVSPQRGKEVYYAIYTAFASIAGASTALLSGSLIDTIGTARIGIFGMSNIEMIFLCTSAARFSSLLLIIKIADIGARPVTVMVHDITYSLVKGIVSFPSRLVSSEGNDDKDGNAER